MIKKWTNLSDDCLKLSVVKVLSQGKTTLKRNKSHCRDQNKATSKKQRWMWVSYSKQLDLTRQWFSRINCNTWRMLLIPGMLSIGKEYQRYTRQNKWWKRISTPNSCFPAFCCSAILASWGFYPCIYTDISYLYPVCPEDPYKDQG